ncbi:YbfB/YjiJ family MFS transporter [Arthrobacter agilis]|uniref:MFS transporter n=1 Tax=Arthrobacter agilis TaxID=37921 RepID=UPI000B35B25F|nr:MFS transporter [Arthrobacter agilis]OUM43074.1 hypothetical protein B8W74_07485 [Arthrobacter agilis]PPB46019.1 MFS transporter [Arthrobacter agilis]TPV25559.1 YbfB/YjiJ family MFS transporter [Arthrobacter agilis]
MKRSLYPFFAVSAVTVIAATYGLARLGYGLFLPAFSRSFDLNPTLGGRLASGASLLYCVAAIIGFRHAPSNPRLVTALAGITATSGSVGIATAPAVAVFAAAVLLAGMGAGFASPALVELVRRNTGQARQGRMQSVVNSGTGFGVVGAGVMSLVLGDAWRMAWLIVAAIAAVSTLAVLRLDRTPSHETRHDAPLPSLFAKSTVQGLSRPLVGSFVFGMGCAAVWVYGRSTLEEAGFDAELSALAWIALGAGGAAAVLLAPWLAGMTLHVTWSSAAIATGGATALLGAAPGSAVLACASAALFGLSYTAATSVLILWASSAADGQGSSGAGGTSLLFIALVLGQAAGAPLTGVLLQTGGTGTAFTAAAALCAASSCAVAHLRRRARPARGVRTPTTAGPARRPG